MESCMDPNGFGCLGRVATRKKASGEGTEDRPFLYLVNEDDAYVVDGPANSAQQAYRNICSS
jgi:hypothetical protein